MVKLFFTTLLVFFAAVAVAETPRYTASAQFAALAPNADGQEAYSLKLSTNEWEAGVFSNQYIYAGDQPLSGATYALRFPLVDDSNFWQFYTQLGGGVSNGGLIGEITWGMNIPLLPIWLPMSAPKYWPALRIDITTQLIFIRSRAITWSYPLWVGISVPF